MLQKTDKTMTEDHTANPENDIPESTEKRRFETTCDALAAGKKDGAAKAREKGPQLKSGVSDLFHDMAYGVAYGSFFAGAFLHELLQRSVREGISKGVSAGRNSGKNAATKVSDAVASETVPEGAEINPSF